MPEEDRSSIEQIIALIDSLTLDPARAQSAGVLSIASLATAILMCHQASSRIALALVRKSLGNESEADESFAVYEESVATMHKALTQALRLANAQLERE